MAGKLGLEARVTIGELAKRKVAKREIARKLGVSEGSVRYHLRRMAAGEQDGRKRQQSSVAPHHGDIIAWREALGGGPVNLLDLHAWLRDEHGFSGSARSVQRYYGKAFPKPRRRARRRVETPPGAQAQVDWAHWPRVLVGGRERDLLSFSMQLSHSRMDAMIWTTSKDQLSWQSAHNSSFRRLEGIPATVRVDNEKTAISRGAGSWGEVNKAYRRYALEVRFHVDACQPRAPEAKGKVERRIRDKRLGIDPFRRHWNDLSELQALTDQRVLESANRRQCPVTGTSVLAAWEAEKRYLQSVPILPEPFNLVAQRQVRSDCLVSFEGRQYSVPFALVGTRVEVRGGAGRVQVVHGGSIMADHPRHTEEVLVIDSRHFEGESTDAVIAPMPLGRMGKRLQEIWEMETEKRPLDLYAALAEVAR
jgi:transposase